MARSEMLRHRKLALFVGAIGLLLLVVMGVRLLRKRARFSYEIASSATTQPRPGRAQGYEAVDLPLAEGGSLRGSVRAPTDAGAPWVLFFPGNAAKQREGSIELLERLRGGRDLGVAVWTYRGFDGSDGEPSPAAAATDARAQLAYLRSKHHVSPSQLAIAGYSMGSGIALRLAVEQGRRGQTPRALILLAPFSWLTLAPTHWMRRLWEVQRYETGDVASNYPGACLVLAGFRDGALPVHEHARPLVAKLGARVRYIELPDRDHVNFLDDEAALAPVADFLFAAP